MRGFTAVGRFVLLVSALWGARPLGAVPTARAQDGDAEDAGLQDAEPSAVVPQRALGSMPADETEPAPDGVSLSELRAEAGDVPLWQRGVSLVGLCVMVGLGWLLSAHRDKFPWRIVLFGVGLQVFFGVIVLKTTVGLAFFSFLNDVVTQLLQFTSDGSRFLFGNYLDNEFTVALNVLPTIVFFSSLMAVLYHLGVMQWLVRGVAWVMQRTLRTSGAETLSAAANIFVGQTEAPLVVKPFVNEMTRSELMAVMTGGFATVAGGVLAAYVGMLHEAFPDIAGHLIAASVMSAPASLLIAKVIVPETGQAKTAGTLEMNVERLYANVIDAAAGGASDGMKLALNVGAMLLAFLALVAMVNYIVELPALWHNRVVWGEVVAGLTADSVLPEGCADPQGASAYQACIDWAAASAPGEFVSWTPWSLQRMLGVLFWPIALVMGVPAADCSAVGGLLGEKLILNEFVAYIHLAGQLGEGGLSPRATVIATYALCGFANVGSIAIQIGGIGGIAPKRRADLAKLGVRAMLGGTLAAFMTACVAGMLV